jgi:hypothetical protein
VQRGFDFLADALASLAIIISEKLYYPAYPTPDAYVSERWGKSLTRIRQLNLFVNTRAEIERVTGVTLPTEATARFINSQDCPEYLRYAVPRIAAASAARDGKPLDTGYLRRATEILTEAGNTAHVDTGDGTSTPIDAALDVSSTEATLRKRQYIQERFEDRLRRELGLSEDTPIVHIHTAHGVPEYTYQQLVNALPAGDLRAIRVLLGDG